MRKSYEPEIRESERPGYLEAQARKLSGRIGIDIGEAKRLLCNFWEWDIKKYTGREVRD